MRIGDWSSVVGASELDVEQEALQLRRDGGLAHRLGQRTPADLEALDADGEGARHLVHARVQAGHGGDEEAGVDRGEELVGGTSAGRDSERRRSDARRRGDPPLSGTGGRGARAAAGVAVVQEPLEHAVRSEEHTSELQSLMRISYAVFCLKKTTNNT